MNEISQQWRHPPRSPPGASYSCTSCCPTGYRPHGAAGHRPASKQSFRPGSYPLHGCGVRSLDSTSQSHCWCGCGSSARWGNHSKSKSPQCHPPPSWQLLSASYAINREVQRSFHEMEQAVQPDEYAVEKAAQAKSEKAEKAPESR